MTTEAPPYRIALAIATPGRRSQGEAIARSLHDNACSPEVVVVTAATVFVGFDAVLALDAESLAHVRAVGARRVAYLSDAWWEDAHMALGATLVFRAYGPAQGDFGSPDTEGSLPREVRCGPVAPLGMGPLIDKDAAKRERSLALGSPIVLVAESAFDSEGAQAIILQLALVKPAVQLLLHVGRDTQLAERLRELIPAHGLEALLMADTVEMPTCGDSNGKFYSKCVAGKPGCDPSPDQFGVRIGSRITQSNYPEPYTRRPHRTGTDYLSLASSPETGNSQTSGI